jgi:hypothetical protein
VFGADVQSAPLHLLVPRLDKKFQVVRNALVNGREVRNTESEMPHSSVVDVGASINHFSHKNGTTLAIVNRFILTMESATIVLEYQFRFHFVYLLSFW